jgi:diaminopimelate decarboxylase
VLRPTQVVRSKSSGEREFVIVDAGMNDLMRPALYSAHHDIEVVGQARPGMQAVDIVGPVCESADTFAKARMMPKLETGDLLAIRTAAAYGFVMASTYNGRPRVAEILVDHTKGKVVRQRETLEDLWRGEVLLDGSLA